MKIGILSQKPSLHSTQRLAEAARGRGHEVRVINYLRCYIDITSKRPRVIYGGEQLDFDAIIPRIGASYSFYGAAVVRQFEMMGVYSLNESQAITRARDKLRSLQLLSRKGLGMPTTGFAHSTKDIEGLISIAGKPPVVIKFLEGTQGIGVVLAETKQAAESVIMAFRELDANILVQEYIAEAKGTDLRGFVIGDKVVAAMQRKALPGEFRANLHRGASAEKVKLNPEERKTILKAAKVMGLNCAGVDMMRSQRGPLILEVNASPGLEGIEGCTGIDVAGKIIEFLERNAVRGKTHDRIRV